MPTKSAVAVLVLVFGCDDKPAERPVAKARPIAPAAAPAPVGPPIEVTAGKLYADYAKDANAADAVYLHHPMVVSGIIGHGRGSTWREFLAAGGADHVTIWFDSPDAARELKGSGPVTVRCASVGMVDVPTLRACVADPAAK